MRDSSWQKVLANGFSSSVELLSFLNIPVNLTDVSAEQQFKTRVPRSFAARMKAGDPQDPLLLQVLAQAIELDPAPGFVLDPLEELSANPIPGLIHKYHGRVLLTITGTCAVNCRYCFRRHFPYQDNNPGRSGWQAALDYIAQDTSLHEVIFSGGDPLLASNRLLTDILEQLASIKHVTTVRFHTRVPVVLPERVDLPFLDLLMNCGLKKVMVLHINHAQEIDDSVHAVCRDVAAAGCILLNQSVLLKGVNARANILAALSERLFDCGILPYYLHLLDNVQGASHFDISHEQALAIFHELQSLLPGYLVPRLAREQAGKRHKTLYV